MAENLTRASTRHDVDAAPDDHHPLPGPNILLVEDRESVVRLLAVGFDYMGLTLNPVFGSGQTLLDHLDTEDLPGVDLFLIDIKLPDIDGVELLRRLRARGEKRPAALISAWAPPARKVLQELDAIYLAKPFHLPHLARELRHLAASRSRTPQAAMSA